MVCLDGLLTTLSSESTEYALDLDATQTSVGTRIVVDASANTISLPGGGVYFVAAEYYFRNTSTAATAVTFTLQTSSKSITYSERVFGIIGTSGVNHTATATVSAVIDLRVGGNTDISLFASWTQAGSGSVTLEALNGWVTVQQLPARPPARPHAALTT
jgi:hypothetical protein